MTTVCPGIPGGVPVHRAICLFDCQLASWNYSLSQRVRHPKLNDTPLGRSIAVSCYRTSLPPVVDIAHTLNCERSFKIVTAPRAVKRVAQSRGVARRR